MGQLFLEHLPGYALETSDPRPNGPYTTPSTKGFPSDTAAPYYRANGPPADTALSVSTLIGRAEMALHLLRAAFPFSQQKSEFCTKTPFGLPQAVWILEELAAEVSRTSRVKFMESMDCDDVQFMESTAQGEGNHKDLGCESTIKDPEGRSWAIVRCNPYESESDGHCSDMLSRLEYSPPSTPGPRLTLPSSEVTPATSCDLELRRSSLYTHPESDIRSTPLSFPRARQPLPLAPSLLEIGHRQQPRRHERLQYSNSTITRTYEGSTPLDVTRLISILGLREHLSDIPPVDAIDVGSSRSLHECDAMDSSSSSVPSGASLHSSMFSLTESGSITSVSSVRVMALYRYTAIEIDEISFEEGDVIANVDTSISETWWSGTNASGERGLFPANHVHVIPNP